ncbi:MAG: hypothetical protein ACJA07_004757 [Rhodococcus sp. (in: high G+C Gram-positive bacteria)]|jgi:hypothetical protein
MPRPRNSGTGPPSRTSKRGTAMSNNIIEQTKARLILAATEDDGMSTAEYAIGTIAAAAFGAVLYTVVTGGSIVDALTGIIDRALNTAV